jgi:ABC-type phosphate transport system permease subunit
MALSMRAAEPSPALALPPRDRIANALHRGAAWAAAAAVTAALAVCVVFVLRQAAPAIARFGAAPLWTSD